MNDQYFPPVADAKPTRGPIPMMGSGDDGEVNLRELFDVVWSGKWVVAAVAALVVLLGLARALTAVPIYQASGLVQVEKEDNQLSASVEELSSMMGSPPADVPAEIAILKSRMVLASVADNLNLHIHVQPQYFPLVGATIARRRAGLAEPAPAPFGLERYAWGGERLRVTGLDIAEGRARSFILEATDSGYTLLAGDGSPVLSGKPGERASSADGSVSIFVQELVARPKTRFQVSLLPAQVVFGGLAGQLSISEQPRESGILNVQATAASPQLAARLVNEVQDAYLRQNVERRSAQAEQSLQFLQQQMPQLKAKVEEAQARLNSYQVQEGTVDLQQETNLMLTRAVALETERLRLSQERDAALHRYTAQHPAIIALDEQIRRLEREQAGLGKQVEALPEKQQEILGLMRDLQVNTQLYTALLNSMQELQMAKAGTVGSVRIIDRALEPLSPIKPDRKQIVLVSALVGLILGVGAVFAIRTLLRGIDRPEEVERALGLPTYASIPYSNGQRRLNASIRRKQKGNHILAALQGQDVAIEALRSLRTSLHFAMLEAPNNIVMFTGPTAGIGKSFVTINLGAVLADSGKRTLVMDADLRRGRLHRYANADQAPGISDYVTGKADESALVRNTAVENLFFVPTGTRPPNPAEILMHGRFSALLEHYSAAFDYVLIDTPPALPVTDAAIVGRLAGTTLVILKSAEHPMRAIEETVKRLRQAGVQVRGTIFDQVGARIGSYGHGAYGYAYGYSTYGYRTAQQDR